MDNPDISYNYDPNEDDEDIEVIPFDELDEDNFDDDVEILSNDEEEISGGAKRKCHDYRRVKSKYVNSKCHDTTYRCKICGRKKVVREKHRTNGVGRRGIASCSDCGRKIFV